MSDTNIELPTLVTYNEWLKGTAVTISTRSTMLKELDAKLLQYERNPSIKALALVQEKFDIWQSFKQKETSWTAASRDKNQIVTLLSQQLKGKGDTDIAQGAPVFMQADLVNSRLGVLYLFGHINCNDSIFSVALEGAFDVTNSALDFADVDSKIATGFEYAQTPTTMLSEKLEDRIRNISGSKSVTSSQIMNTTVMPPTNHKLRELWEKIRAMLYNCGEKILAAINEKLALARQKINEIREDPGAAAMEYLPGILRKLIDFLTGHFLKDAAPFIGAGLDIAKGVFNTVDAGVTKFKEWMMGRDVDILTGHPGTIIEAIRKAMWFSVGSGLYETLKGGLNLGMEFATTGASKLVSIIVGIVEALVKTIWKIVEIYRMNSFFKEAAMHWEMRNESSGIHNRPIAFNNWFKSYAVDLPAISVLSLNSGICGDKMRFLKMYKSDDMVISQAQFDAGCHYVDSLKIWGSEYLDDAGFSFVSKSSDVAGYLTLAQNHTKELSTGGKVVKFTKKYLNA